MKNVSAAMAGALLSGAWIVPAAMAQPACVADNGSVPPGANTTDRSAPFVFARNARHVDRPTVAQTLPSALEWLWKGYPAP